jgi:hypothetical protein
MIITSALLLSAATALAADETTDKTILFPPGKDAVMILTVPKAAKITTDEGKTTIDTPKGNVYLWVVAATDAKAVNNSVTVNSPNVKSEAKEIKLNKIVESEVKEIKVDETKKIKVADADAKQLTAKTKEADDGDAGTSAFVVFKFGGKVIVACVHGEGDAASRQLPLMLEILGTAKKP